MPASSQPFVTEAEFLARPIPPTREELFDGEIVVSPSARYRHQRVVGRLFRVLDDWASMRGAPWVAALAPLDIRIAPNRIFQPDLAVFDAELPLDELPIHVRPRLVVEVLSPSNRHWDRHTKRLAYGEAGVDELWAVDPHGTVEVWHGAGLRQREVPSSVLASVALPGLEVDLTALFAD